MWKIADSFEWFQVKIKCKTINGMGDLKNLFTEFYSFLLKNKYPIIDSNILLIMYIAKTIKMCFMLLN